MICNILHDRNRTDRYELLIKEAEQQGYEYRLWDAVKTDGKPKIGISQAHRRIVQHAKDNNLTEILILEDDIKWCGNGAYNFFLKNKPKEYSIYLTGIMWGKIRPDNTVSDFSGMQGYLIHNSFYDKFLSVDPTKDIDRAMKNLGIFVVSNPFVAMQHETISDNTKKIHLNSKYYRNRPLYAGE